MTLYVLPGRCMRRFPLSEKRQQWFDWGLMRYSPFGFAWEWMACSLKIKCGTQYNWQDWYFVLWSRSKPSVSSVSSSSLITALPTFCFRQVTIFGESAGAQSVSLHLMIQSSKPLFKQAVLQSLPFSIPLKTRWGITSIGDCVFSANVTWLGQGSEVEAWSSG